MDRLITRARAAGYFADFAISLPTMLTIVQEIISLYPLWEELEGKSVPASHALQVVDLTVDPSTPGTSTAKPSDSLKESEVIPMIQKMQRLRAVDLLHPADGGVNTAKLAAAENSGVRGLTSVNPAIERSRNIVAGVKRRAAD